MDCFCWLSRLIGRTPLSKITYTYKGTRQHVYVKHEHYNLTGSIKDRIALHILYQAYSSGALRPGNPIVEATSGNTGISFAAVGRALGHPVIIYMPDWMSQERINLIKSFGAEIRLVSREAGGFLGCIAKTKQLKAENPTVFLPSQFTNPQNAEAHYQTTAKEIWHQMKRHFQTPTALVAGVGTGGTIMGIGRYFKNKDATIRLFPLEPENSPTLSTGCKTGKHRIQGISDDFVPELICFDELDTVVAVDDGDAIRMAKKFADKLGLGVGISSGANFLGAVKIQNELPSGQTVVTVFPDDNKKYLSTDLMNDEARKDFHLTDDIDDMVLEATACMPEKFNQKKLYPPLRLFHD